MYEHYILVSMVCIQNIHETQTKNDTSRSLHIWSKNLDIFNTNYRYYELL